MNGNLQDIITSFFLFLKLPCLLKGHGLFSKIKWDSLKDEAICRHSHGGSYATGTGAN